MALNYSHMPVFPSHISEYNLWSTRTVNGLAEGVSEKYVDSYPRQWHARQGEMVDWCFSCWSDNVDSCCSSESNPKDIVDLLPSDPFGMNIVTGWYGGFGWSNGGSSSQENRDLFAGLNAIWSNALKSQQIPSFSQGFEKLDAGVNSVPTVQFDQKLIDIEHMEVTEMEDSLAPYDIGYQSACNEDAMGLSNESTSCSNEVQFEEEVEVEGAAQFEEAPHEALKFSLLYLELKDLLSVEGVCSSLRSEVLGDSLLWKKIHIDPPLNKMVTDDLLLKLACRANGDLQCLNLVDCPNITDDSIRHILETNSRLTKLFVPGCKKITIEGILNNIRTHNSNKGVPGIKHLRIGGIYGITREHFRELKFLLGTDDHKLGSNHKPRFYHQGNFYLPYDDDRAIDIEMCPICENFRLVYDCPTEGCQVKDMTPQACRACKFCISRCDNCGRCIDDIEYEETFWLGLLCSDCCADRDCQNMLDNKVDPYAVQHEPSGHGHA